MPAMATQSAEAKIYDFPDLKPGSRRGLVGPEIGTQFDWGQRLFAYYGGGDVFDYGEWNARDMKVMFTRDGACAASELVLTLPIREADLSIEPAKGDKGECDFARGVLLTPDTDGGMQTPQHEVTGQCTSAQIFRRSFFEKVWKIRDTDGKIIYDKVAYRPPATCQARYNARTGSPHGFRQQVWLFGGNLMLSRKQKVPGYVEIPHIRSFIYTHGKHREPLTGVSEMEVAYWCYQTKMKLLYLWYHFLENQALQRLVVYGVDQPEANQRAADVASMKGSGVVGLNYPPADQHKAFDTITADGDAGKFFSEAMGFLENWQFHSILAGFMGLSGAQMGGKGSYALSQDQSSFYLKSRQAVAKEQAQSMSRDIIRPLIVINFGSRAAIPNYKFGPLQDEQIQALLTMFQTMASAPVLHIPLQVFDLICERMASILQLDVDQVHAALVSSANQRAAQLQATAPPGMPAEASGSIGALNGMANAAVGIAQQAAMRTGGAGMRPPPPAGARAAQPLSAGAGLRPPAKPPMIPPPGRMG